MSEPTRFFFVHLQKTAGTALYQRLREHFGTDAVYPTPGDQGSPRAVTDVDFLADRFRAHRHDLRVITGHFPLCTVEVLDAPFTTFTLLRDPVERTLSFLRHQKMVDERFQDRALEDIYTDPVLQNLMRNHMVKMLAITATEMTAGLLTPMAVRTEDEGAAWLERAKISLAEGIDVVGLQEHFDDFCLQLAHRFGWDLGPPRFANRTPPLPATDGFRDRIAVDNHLDVELYRHAVALRVRG
ncbi:MAG: hypothetical protein WKF43_00025 [Acidimicrobiales bacterium]